MLTDVIIYFSWSSGSVFEPVSSGFAILSVFAVPAAKERKRKAVDFGRSAGFGSQGCRKTEVLMSIDLVRTVGSKSNRLFAYCPFRDLAKLLLLTMQERCATQPLKKKIQYKFQQREHCLLAVSERKRNFASWIRLRQQDRGGRATGPTPGSSPWIQKAFMFRNQHPQQ